MDYLQNVPVEKQYTVNQFAKKLSVDPSAVRYMILDNRLPNDFEVIQLSPRKRIIVEKEALNSKPKYIHPSELPADAIVKINNALQDEQFIKPSGKPNIKKIAEYVNQHYWSVKRYIEKDYKEPDEARADKGVSRKFKNYKKSDFKKIKRSFEYHFQRSAQKNLQQALREVKKELGEDIPVRLASEWRHALLGTHTMKHYYRRFIKNFVPHARFDKWGETKHYLDVVEVDVWPVDVPYVDNNYKEEINKQLDELKKHNIKKWEKQRVKACTAEALVFIDRKTRDILQLLLCEHSVSGSDVKKGLMLLFQEHGAFKQLYIDNGREFFNKEVIDFVYAILNDVDEFDDRETGIKITELKEEGRLQTAAAYQPYGKGIVERFFKTLKDRWAVYHDAYSPSQKDSRKPTLKLSAVQPTLNFNELGISLRKYIEEEYIHEKRPEMFLDPGRTKDADVNQGRPTTIYEARERAYANPDFKPRPVDPYKLAYHYAEKIKATFREGVCRISYKTYVLRYTPDNPEEMLDYLFKKKAVTVLINPANIYEAWFFDGKKLLTRAEDPRYEKERGTGIERASYLQKKQNKAIRAFKKHQKLIDEYEAELKNKPGKREYTKADYNPDVSIKQTSCKDFEVEEVVEKNNSESNSIWDLDD